MNNYHLKILYPSSNNGRTEQYYSVRIKADEITESEAGTHLAFLIKDELVASYPAQYTIIERVEKIKANQAK